MRKRIFLLLCLLLTITLLLVACNDTGDTPTPAPDEPGSSAGADDSGNTEPPSDIKKVSEGLQYTFADDGSGYIVVGIGTCSDSEIVIPAVYQDKPVIGLADRSFEGRTYIRGIVLPNSLAYIGIFAFSGCTGLTNIAIPNSVISIGDGAFDGCKGLMSITIGSGVTSATHSIFHGCHKLVEVYNLSNLTFQKSSNSNVFTGVECDALVIHTSLLEASKVFTDENDFAFYEDGEICYLLGYLGKETALTLPKNCRGKKYAIYQDAFYSCTGLTSITIPNSVTDIGEWAFQGCTNLTSATIGDSVTSIGEWAFQGCTSLTSVTFGNSITSIGDWAFQGCTSLTSVTTGNSIMKIGECAFWRCMSLKSINFKGAKTQWNGIRKDKDWNSDTGNYTIHCTDGDIAKQ